jgi:protein TonB
MPPALIDFRAASFRERASLARKLVIAGLLISAGGTVVSSQAATELPIPLNRFTPTPPADLRRSAIGGVVTLRFWIDATGKVTNPEVVNTTDWGFARPSLDAIAKWTFKPARRDGVAVGTWVRISFRFVFDDEGVNGSCDSG